MKSRTVSPRNRTKRQQLKQALQQSLVLRGKEKATIPLSEIKVQFGLK